MWNTILQVFVSVAPILVSVVSLVVHFFVFHRLKCTKEMSECIKEDLPKFRTLYRELLAPTNLVADLSDDDLASITVGTYKKLVEDLTSLGERLDAYDKLFSALVRPTNSVVEHWASMQVPASEGDKNNGNKS